MELSKKLEIFIRTYNRCDLMKTTLQSVLNQSAKNIKVTVFDNASTDGTGDYVRSLMQEHGNLFYFRTQENIIFEKRLDIVLPLISAEYVIFFHDDDIMHPQYAECVIKALEDHPEAELVTSWMWPFRKEEEVVFDDYSTCSYRLYREKLDFVSYVYASWILYWDKNIFFPGVVYKRDNLIGLQSRFDVMGKIADKPFVLDSVKTGNVIQLEGYFLKYRMHGGQDSATSANGPFPEQIIAHNKFFYDMLRQDRQALFNFNLVASEWLRRLYEMGGCGRFISWSRFFARAFREGAVSRYGMLSGIKPLSFVMDKLNARKREKIRFFYESGSVRLPREERDLVSIIIPVYNCGPYLAQCLDSVLAQSYRNLEIILVDDGSTDSSYEICRSYEEKDSRIKLLHKENGGQSSARNLGLDKCTGDYIMFIDSDDFVSPLMVEKLYGRITKDGSDLAMCNASYRYEDGRTRPVWSGWKSAAIWSEKDFWDENVNLVNVATMLPVNKIYPRKIFDGLRFAEGRVQEDELILDKVIRQCKRISVIPDSLYFYRQRSSGTMGGLHRRISFGYEEACLSRFYYFMEKGYDDFLFPAIYLAYRGLEGEHKKLRPLGRLSGDKANGRLYASHREEFNAAIDRYLARDPRPPKGIAVKLRLLKKSFLLYRLYCAVSPPLAALYHRFRQP